MIHTSKLMGWLVALLLVIGGVYFLYSYFRPAYQGRFPDLQSVGQLKRSGDNAAALAQYQQIQADTSKSAEEKANAQLYVIGVSYSVSGNQSDLIT